MADADVPGGARTGPSVRATEVRGFLEAIHTAYGYDLRDYAPASIERRVQTALVKSGMSNLAALQRAVLLDEGLFARVLADLTVSVSDFFRDPSFYLAFRTVVIPVLRTYPYFTVWHAGCATGEEAYSTAILLNEEGLGDRCQIYATDLSRDSIEHAKRGVYRPHDHQGAAMRYRQSGGLSSLAAHATIAYGQLAMPEALRRRVLFFQHDLVSDYVFGEMTVIFCRNVLIYFGQSLRERVVDKLRTSLRLGGFLCLGASERPPERQPTVFAATVPGARIFQHRGAP